MKTVSLPWFMDGEEFDPKITAQELDDLRKEYAAAVLPGDQLRVKRRFLETVLARAIPGDDHVSLSMTRHQVNESFELLTSLEPIG